MLEMLVAMAIFAIIGLGANEMLRTIIRTHDRARQITDTLAQLNTAFVIMQRDITQIVPRGIRDVNGDPLPALMVGNGQSLIEFTRTGWNNPTDLPRSDLQRVAYQLTDNGVLQREIWMVLDRAPDSRPITQTLLTGIKDFRVDLLKADGTTVDNWPDTTSTGTTGAITTTATTNTTTPTATAIANADTNALPVAVEVFVDTRSMGELRRVFPLVSSSTQPQQAGESQSGAIDRSGGLSGGEAPQ